MGYQCEESGGSGMYTGCLEGKEFDCNLLYMIIKPFLSESSEIREIESISDGINKQLN